MTSVKGKDGQGDNEEFDENNMDSIADLKNASQGEIDGSARGQQVDNDMNMYFEKDSLLEHLANLEEDNLFKIHLV